VQAFTGQLLLLLSEDQIRQHLSCNPETQAQFNKMLLLAQGNQLRALPEQQV
jgi:hypothetical protein